jgi:hypothetical protein
LALRKAFPEITPGQTSALATIRDIRKRAETRGFAFADQLFADDDGLSMATSPGLVTVHAMLLSSTGRPVLDIAAGCAIEALQLATTGLDVTCYEIDPARAHFATINAERCPTQGKVTVIHGDCRNADAEGTVIYYDPSRRADGTRNNRSFDSLEPPVGVWADFVATAGMGLAKLPTGLPDDETMDFGDAYAFLAEGKDCKECILTVGIETPWQSGDVHFVDTGLTISPSLNEVPMFPDLADAKWILDPHPALCRAGALGVLCEMASAGLASPMDDYLMTADETPPEINPKLASIWQVIALVQAKPRHVTPILRERDARLHIVKRRNAGKDVDIFVAALGKQKGKNDICGIFMVMPDGLYVALCQPKAWHEAS